GFACNPCTFACPFGAITKPTTGDIPVVDYDKCTGCMQCVNQCPGLAIFGYNQKKDWLFLPFEYETEENTEVYLVDNNGNKIGDGIIEKILKKKNKTNVARVKSLSLSGDELTKARGFIVKEKFPEDIEYYDESSDKTEAEEYICHCEDVKLKDILDVVGDRKFISIDEIKHTTRLGMGPCRGKRCIKRLRQVLPKYDISLIGDATPRGPLSNQLSMGEMYPKELHEDIVTSKASSANKKIKVQALIAGGGIGGSALFRYLAEEGQKPVMLNYGRGSSWRNIAGGRPNFSLPELSDIADNNLDIFRQLQEINNINFLPIKYATFAHDEQMYKDLEASMAWSNAEMIEPKDFTKKLSPFFNPNITKYKSALITDNCWQATPGLVVDSIREIGKENGGTILEDCELIDVKKSGNTYNVIVKNHNNEYLEYETEIFINALGDNADKYAKQLGLETGLFPVKHQAFITQRMPNLGVDNTPLPMIIDRRKYKGFSAVYGQQLGETGQIIGCASPANEALETSKNPNINSQEFLQIVSETFVDWIPNLSSVSFQAVWSGYYVEPKMIIDPDKGLFIGLRGQGFMLGQYLAKLYVDKLTGKKVPEYFDRLKLEGDGLLEKAFK
ncbi:MAG: FAD-dependent oxidoreductase, partial [Bacteroidota bacterium]|nr:FAD-dependent oxidoreductase [Bacteroidota bacterium]